MLNEKLGEMKKYKTGYDELLIQNKNLQFYESEFPKYREIMQRK